MEADTFAFTGSQKNIIVTISEYSFEKPVSLLYSNSVYTLLTRTGIGFQQGLLNSTAFGCQHDIMAVDIILITKITNIEICADTVVGLNTDDILDCTALRGLGSLRYFVYLKPVTSALVGEKEHSTVSICNINMLDEIFLLGGAALGAHTAAVLETVLTQRSALDVSGM